MGNSTITEYIFSQVGVPNFTSILQMWLHNCKIKFADSVGASMFVKLPESKPTSCLALEVCLDQERSAEMVSPKYLILSTESTG